MLMRLMSRLWVSVIELSMMDLLEQGFDKIICLNNQMSSVFMPSMKQAAKVLGGIDGDLESTGDLIGEQQMESSSRMTLVPSYLNTRLVEGETVKSSKSSNSFINHRV